MKKLIFLALLFVGFYSQAQTNRFPSIDSAKNYVLRYIRNSTVESFTNLRMQNVSYGTLELLDSLISAGSGSGVSGVDSIWRSQSATKDTLKYSISGTTYTICTLDRVDLKLNISDTSAMLTNYVRSQRLIDTAAAIRSSIGSGGGGGLADDSTNTFGQNVNLYTGILKPTWSAGTNTWGLIDDASHSPMGMTSVTADGVKITVNYYTGSKVMTMMGVWDETTSALATTNSGDPYYTNAPYMIGARTFVNYAEFYISKLTHASFRVRYDGSAWVITNGPTDAYDPTSPAWTVSWSAGRLRIENVSARFKKIPGANMVAFGGGTTNMRYIPSVNFISEQWVDIYFWDASTGAQMTDATPPTNFAVALDFGIVATAVNPLSEDFGASANFFLFGVMKK